jgi:hypothetical protein
VSVRIIRPWPLAVGMRTFLLPPLLAIPPPRRAKDSKIESIHGQLLGTLHSHLTPTPVHDSGLVPTTIAVACLVDPSRQGSYADEDSTDNDDDNMPPRRSSGAGIYKSNYDVTDDLTNNCDGQEHDDLHDFDDHISMTDAEVSKFTFIERLAHYMEGECCV